MSDFDVMCDLFTSYARAVANWQQNYFGAAYSTRLRAAIADMKFAIAEAEKHPEIGATALCSSPSPHAEVREAGDGKLTPKAFVDDILSACDPSNWDAERNKGEYFAGLKEAYEAIHEIANEYQLSMYAWTRAAPADASGAGGLPGDATCYIERSKVREILITSNIDNENTQTVLQEVDALPIFTASDFASVVPRPLHRGEVE